MQIGLASENLNYTPLFQTSGTQHDSTLAVTSGASVMPESEARLLTVGLQLTAAASRAACKCARQEVHHFISYDFYLPPTHDLATALLCICCFELRTL